MNSGLASLHKVLKDETRRKIVLLLNEKDNLSYTDLLKALGIDNTGRMNYHLKVLDDLVMKREDGQYALTEKGKLASRLLLEFPEKNRQQLGMKPKWWRKFWISAAVVVTFFLIILLGAFFLGYIDMNSLYRNLLWTIGVTGIAYMIQHITKDVLSEKGQSKLRRAVIITFGTVSIGGFLWFALMIAFNFSGIKNTLSQAIGDTTFAVMVLISCYITGAFIGNWISKRMTSNF